MKSVQQGGVFKSIIKEKCPHCHKGDVYRDSPLLSLPPMHQNCSECGYRFDRESGYFIGAMYISYGLAVAQAMIAFGLYYFFLPKLAIYQVVLLISMVIVLFSRKNYTLSRVIYMNIFPW